MKKKIQIIALAAVISLTACETAEDKLQTEAETAGVSNTAAYTTLEGTSENIQQHREPTVSIPETVPPITEGPWEPNQHIDPAVNLPPSGPAIDRTEASTTPETEAVTTAPKEEKVAWAEIYQSFLTDKSYLNMGQEYGPDGPQYGFVFDLDHDSIPELFLKDGMDGGTYIYSYVDGKVDFIGDGPKTAFIKLTGPECEFDGLYEPGSNEWMNANVYSKYGSSILAYEGTLRPYCDMWIMPEKLDRLTAKMPLYDMVAGASEDPAWAFYELEAILAQLGTLVYDYRDDGYRDNGYGAIHWEFPLKDLVNQVYDPCFFFARYSPDSVSDEHAADYKEEEDYFRNYISVDGDTVDWIFKNIFNLTDDIIDKAHQECNYDGKQYNISLGDVYGYTRTPPNILNIEKIGDAFHITYCWEIPDEEMGGMYTVTRYALAKYKTIDGIKYWSVYMTSNKPLYDEAGLKQSALSEMPDHEALEKLLLGIYYELGMNYEWENSNDPAGRKLLSSICLLNGYTFAVYFGDQVDEGTRWVNKEDPDPSNPPDPRGYVLAGEYVWNGYLYISLESVEWIATKVFHMPKDDYDSMISEFLEDKNPEEHPYDWHYYEDGYIYNAAAGVGGFFDYIAPYADIEKNGDNYSIRYFVKEDQASKTGVYYDAELVYEDIGGQKYWTVRSIEVELKQESK